MEYRRLGSAGIKVSVLSFGSWVTFKTQINKAKAAKALAHAYDYGVNFFDNAEGYAGGESEKLMGQAIKQLKWDRTSYIISSKYFWGLKQGINQKNTLNRKYLLNAVDGSLKRLGLDYIDLVYCHRPDPETTVEETVWAMSDIIAQGKALYWGTSEWSADQILEAWTIADRYGLRKPQMEQPQYNLFWRDRVEKEYSPLYKKIGLGLTTWSPLASGILTGKYNNGIPKGSRLSLPGFEWLKEKLTQDKIDATKRLAPIADELGCSLSQLAIAWCAQNPNVSTVITGATSPKQLDENMGSLEVLSKLTPEICDIIQAASSVK